MPQPPFPFPWPPPPATTITLRPPPTGRPASRSRGPRPSEPALPAGRAAPSPSSRRRAQTPSPRASRAGRHASSLLRSPGAPAPRLRLAVHPAPPRQHHDDIPRDAAPRAAAGALLPSATPPPPRPGPAPCSLPVPCYLSSTPSRPSRRRGSRPRGRCPSLRGLPSTPLPSAAPSPLLAHPTRVAAAFAPKPQHPEPPVTAHTRPPPRGRP